MNIIQYLKSLEMKKKKDIFENRPSTFSFLLPSKINKKMLAQHHNLVGRYI